MSKWGSVVFNPGLFDKSMEPHRELIVNSIISQTYKLDRTW